VAPGDKYKVPRIVFANKMDKTGADFFRCLADIVDRLGAKPVAIQLPIGAEQQFKGLIDLVRMKGVVWEDEGLGAKYHDIDIPADMADQAKEYREKMVEAAVELDDDVMAAWLDGKEPDEGDDQAPDPQGGDHRRLLSGAVRFGLQEQGRAAAARPVIDYLPSPLDVPPIMASIQGQRGRAQADDKAPLSLLAFKIMDDPSSAPSRSAASIRARSPAAPASSTRPASARSASAACC